MYPLLTNHFLENVDFPLAGYPTHITTSQCPSGGTSGDEVGVNNSTNINIKFEKNISKVNENLLNHFIKIIIIQTILRKIFWIEISVGIRCRFIFIEKFFWRIEFYSNVISKFPT